MVNLETPDDCESVLIPRRPFPWVAATGLFFACVVGTFAMMPFTYSLMLQMTFPGISLDKLPMLIAASIVADAVFALFLSLLAIGVGLWLGGKVGMGMPLLDGWDRANHNHSKAFRAIGLGVVSGVLLGGMVVAAAGLLGSSGGAGGGTVTLPPPWEGFLTSIGAGIREEIWLRLGLMTFLTWLGMRISRRTAPPKGLIWSGNFLATLVFAAMHLPQASQLLGLSTSIVTFVFLGNGLPGLFSVGFTGEKA